jgi:hypothetical protein
MTIIATTERARFLLDSAAQCYCNAQQPGISLETKVAWLQDSETFVDLALRAMREASIPPWSTAPGAQPERLFHRRALEAV